jgi:hypothetical protein
MWPWYWSFGTLVLGFSLGFWRGRSEASMKVLDYWLTATDGRVNWSRVTAMVGLGAFVALTIIFLHVYHANNGKDMTEALLTMMGGALGLAGINLGQYIVSKKFPGLDTSMVINRTSGANVAPSPPAPAPSAAPPTP